MVEFGKQGGRPSQIVIDPSRISKTLDPHLALCISVKQNQCNFKDHAIAAAASPQKAPRRLSRHPQTLRLAIETQSLSCRRPGNHHHHHHTKSIRTSSSSSSTHNTIHAPAQQQSQNLHPNLSSRPRNRAHATTSPRPRIPNPLFAQSKLHSPTSPRHDHCDPIIPETNTAPSRPRTKMAKSKSTGCRRRLLLLLSIHKG